MLLRPEFYPMIFNLMIPQRKTRKIKIGDIFVGGDAPIAVQTMCATRTQDIDATVKQIEMLKNAGAVLIRLAVDSKADVEALKQIRPQTDANIVIDLHENYRLIEALAPYVQKVRYNPGHLYHHQPEISPYDKVKYIVNVAKDNDLALRIGVNFGSLDPKDRAGKDPLQVALDSAYEHCDYMEKLDFTRYVVSLKSSDPQAVVNINTEFAKHRPLVPLHLGVTEAGMLPDAEIKSRMAFEKLLANGIGDTLRVSITIADSEKDKEVSIGYQIVTDVESGKFSNFSRDYSEGINVISCPSCSRVENGKFIQLAQRVREAVGEFEGKKLTIAVMGCRVNGPGETDHADFGIWCAPTFVNLKKGTNLLGQFGYDVVVERLLEEIRKG